MKATIRIPTNQYAFIEVEMEGDAIDIVAEHDRLINLCENKEGLNSREWAAVRDKYIMHNEIDADSFAALSKAQRFVINEIKKTFKQIKRKENE